MAELKDPILRFQGNCPDCGEREIILPRPLPEIGDDFDWLTRDFNSFRKVILEELVARFPERKRWTPADMEVVLVEALSAILDRLSDMLDRVTAEAYLETARQPESLRKLLHLIGYRAEREAPAEAGIDLLIDTEEEQIQKLEKFWEKNTYYMDKARLRGPLSIHNQYRMVTVEDYASQLEKHPIVLRASSTQKWRGSWPVVEVALVLWDGIYLDEELKSHIDQDLTEQIEDFHLRYNIAIPYFDRAQTTRSVLRPFLETYRMAGQEVVLRDVMAVGISLSFSIVVSSNYYHSEVRAAVETVLGRGPDGYFSPGKLKFGEDLYVSDIVQELMSLDGVANVCVNRLKKVGDQYEDVKDKGYIKLDTLEIAVCDNFPEEPERGFYKLKFSGGVRG